jgi:hypothetical protein
VAHLFLVAVASDPSLGVPPWPLFAVLLVLTVAFTAAALRLREGLFQGAGVAAGAIVLLVWAAHAPTPGWSTLALAALAAFAALGLLVIRLAEAAGDDSPAWPGAAAAALFALHVGAVLVGGGTAPATMVLAAAHVLALGTLLALATARGWNALGLLAVFTSAVAVFLFAAAHGRPEEWSARLGLAGAVYVVFLAWPVGAPGSPGSARSWPRPPSSSWPAPRSSPEGTGRSSAPFLSRKRWPWRCCCAGSSRSSRSIDATPAGWPWWRGRLSPS